MKKLILITLLVPASCLAEEREIFLPRFSDNSSQRERAVENAVDEQLLNSLVREEYRREELYPLKENATTPQRILHQAAENNIVEQRTQELIRQHQRYLRR